MESWQALIDAVTSSAQDGAAALDASTAAAGRVSDALAETADQAGRAGGAARQAGREAAAGAEKAATGWRAVAQSLADYANTAMDLGKGLGQSLVSGFQSAESAFRSFVTTGKLDFRSLVSSILADLAVLAARRFILGPIANALSGTLGGAHHRAGDGRLGLLEGDSAGVTHDMRPDHDQLQLQAGQRPVGHGFAQLGLTQECGHVVGQRVKLQAHRFLSELVTRQPRPAKGISVLIGVLPGGAALVVRQTTHFDIIGMLKTI